MKSSVKPFRPELEKLMVEARERIAAERFDPVRVKGELAAAAKEGRSSYLLRVEGPVDLQTASATLTLLTWIKGEGMHAEWTRRPIGDADGVSAWDLLVSWHINISRK